MGSRKDDLRIAFSGPQIDQLYKLAKRLMSREPAGHTLQATALVHELYTRLSQGTCKLPDPNAVFFIAIAHQRMVWILNSHGGRRGQRCRESGGEPSSLDALPNIANRSDKELLQLAADIRDASKQIEQRQSNQVAQILALRIFDELTIKEIAEVIGCKEWVVKKDLQNGMEYLKAKLKNYRNQWGPAAGDEPD